MNNNLDLCFLDQRPWWSVRPGLIATLALLVSVLVAVLSRPELIERSLAGL